MSLTPGVPLEFKAKVFLELKEARARAIVTLVDALPINHAIYILKKELERGKRK